MSALDHPGIGVRPMLPGHLQRDAAELAAMVRIAASSEDRPVLMLNMNCYKPEAGYSDGEPYRTYIEGLGALLGVVGGRILWHLPVHGQVVGNKEPVSEVIAIWYPSHAAFLELPDLPGAGENYRLRIQCVERATIHRCPDGGAATGNYAD